MSRAYRRDVAFCRQAGWAAWRQPQVRKAPWRRRAWRSTHLLGGLLLLLRALQRLPLLLQLLLQVCQRLELLRLLRAARLQHSHPLLQARLLLQAAAHGLPGSSTLLLLLLLGVLQGGLAGAGSGAG